jgi:TPR repeat protein
LKSTSKISHDMLQKILNGAEQGNKDNIYFLGLIKLYGISLTKNEAGAVQNFRRAADLGLKEAMTASGMMAYSGIGMEVDYVEALIWFRKAALAKDTNGYWLLAKMLMEGQGVPYPNHQEAATYFHLAADEGKVPQAEHHLGIMYEYGLGVERSFDKAAMYYRRASEKQFTESMYNLALMYLYGRVGFQQNFKQAFPLFEAASLSGHAQSTYMIGVMKTYGYGMEPNYGQAINWFERAAVMGDPRITEKAAASAKELRTLVDEAEELNSDALDKYKAMGEVKGDTGATPGNGYVKGDIILPEPVSESDEDEDEDGDRDSNYESVDGLPSDDKEL